MCEGVWQTALYCKWNVENGWSRAMDILRFLEDGWGRMGGEEGVDGGGKSSQQASQIPWCPASRPKWPIRHVCSSPPPSADAALSGPDEKRWQLRRRVNFSNNQNLTVPGEVLNRCGGKKHYEETLTKDNKRWDKQVVYIYILVGAPPFGDSAYEHALEEGNKMDQQRESLD